MEALLDRILKATRVEYEIKPIQSLETRDDVQLYLKVYIGNLLVKEDAIASGPVHWLEDQLRKYLP